MNPQNTRSEPGAGLGGAGFAGAAAAADRELLFRGVLQGRLTARPWGRRQFGGITLANLLVSLLFTALHFIGHPPLWAAGVLLPSLLYGYFRDRHYCVLPAIALHVFYNAGYFLLPLI
jgi:hypothetical protein